MNSKLLFSIRLAFSIILAMPLTGCISFGISFGSFGEQNEAAQPVQFSDLNLFMSRSSLNGTEFEQYKIGADNELFVECGEIKGGRFFPKLQKFSSIKSHHRDALEQAIGSLLLHQSQSKFPFDSPGDNDTLFDPGKYSVSFTTPDKTLDIKTSLDSISEPDDTSEKDLLTIATTLRQSTRALISGESICGNLNFFGIKG